MSINSKMDKCIVVCSCDGILYTAMRTDSYTQEHDVLDKRQKKSTQKILYFSTCMKFKTGKITDGDTSQNNGDS